MSLHHQEASEHYQFVQSEHKQRVCSSVLVPTVLDHKFFGMLGPWAEFPSGYDVDRWNDFTILGQVGEDPDNPVFISTRYLVAKVTYNYPNGTYVDTTTYDSDNGTSQNTNTYDPEFDYGDIGDFVSQSVDSVIQMTETYEFGSIVHTYESAFTVEDAADATKAHLDIFFPDEDPATTTTFSAYDPTATSLTSYVFTWGTGANSALNKYAVFVVAPRPGMFPWDETFYVKAYSETASFPYDQFISQYGWPASSSSSYEIYSDGVGGYWAPIKYFTPTGGSGYHMLNLISSTSAHRYPDGIECDTGSVDDIAEVTLDSATGELDSIICKSISSPPGTYQFYPSAAFTMQHTNVGISPSIDCCP